MESNDGNSNLTSRFRISFRSKTIIFVAYNLNALP